MPYFIYWKQLPKNYKVACSLTNITLKSAYFIKYFCTDVKDDNPNTIVPEKSSKLGKNKLRLEPPEEPTTCCMSGCANCVWLDYAEELCKYYQDGGDQAIKEINERISDPNIKAYILHEIRMRNKK